MVEIEIYPPMSFRFTSRRVGTYTIDVELADGETLSELMERLSEEVPDVWGKMYNTKSGRMRGPIRTVLNGKALPSSALSRTVPAEGDHIAFKIMYGGG